MSPVSIPRCPAAPPWTAAGGEQGDHHDLGGESVQLPRCAGGGKLTEQIVPRIGRGTVKLLEDVTAELHQRHTRGDELIVFDQPFE